MVRGVYFIIASHTPMLPLSGDGNSKFVKGNFKNVFQFIYIPPIFAYALTG